MDIQKILQDQIELIATTQFAIKPILINRLKTQVILPEGKPAFGNYDNFYDYWSGSQNEDFFDMGTFIRLGSVIESNLKCYYMYKKGLSNLLQLKADPSYKQNIFQRILTGQDGLKMYKDELLLDLEANPHLKKIQEIMINRHLYAHNSGLLDEKYIQQLKDLTGEDLMMLPEINAHFPNEDIYWFKPLRNLPEYIEESRGFFSHYS